MLIDDLMPGPKAARRAGFADTQAFYVFCEREKDRGAPRIVRISAKKRFVVRKDFEAWLAGRLEAGAPIKESPAEPRPISKLLSRVLKFPKQP